MSDTGSGILTGTEPSAVQQQQAAAAAAAAADPNANKAYTQAEVDEMLGKAREQEKNKLHGRLEKAEEKLGQFGTVQEQLNTLQAERDAEAAKAAEAETARLAAEQAVEEEKLSAKALVMKKSEEWDARFQEMEAERRREAAVFAKERAYNEIQDYKRAKLAEPEIAAAIPPQLQEWITGETQEEIDAAIVRMSQTSGSMFQEIQEALASQRQQMPGVSMRAPGSGPIDPSTQPRTLTKEDIDNMSYAQWAQVRGQVLPQSNPYR